MSDVFTVTGKKTRIYKNIKVVAYIIIKVRAVLLKFSNSETSLNRLEKASFVRSPESKF